MSDSSSLGCILVAGGAGYIGSHTVVCLLEAGYEVVVVDNLSNSSKVALDRVEQITGKSVTFYKADLCDDGALEPIFEAHTFEAAIHFAGLKSVSESVADPIHYYRTNIVSSLNLVTTMAKHGCKKLVFSSSATVYGDPQYLPIDEAHPLAIDTDSPYGATKLMIERILQDVHRSDPEWKIIMLRYFNPTGAHESGLIGEDPVGPPANLLPFVCQVAVGRREKLMVFGSDYPTDDGSGKRDFIHVVDLSDAHVAAVKALPNVSIEAVNVGTGKSTSVLELHAAMEAVVGKPIPYEMAARRPGDICECYASCGKAKEVLGGWEAKFGISDICESAWRWQSQNPQGYADQA
ncbi:UDP-glucose 4-epimerase [Thecamonas trahens ATCC 50062]|uniref:UDP-glucose 4-epimerase n=1 Tax=Thecamonas trahens ATCC 50062 TaxID=461836 RepID=A0A0L0D9W3_THETB|nr:UDP-glucose 4-epimerase [Thecamonas trahens ATCC 50062]KNC49040.1 UDP-glucose 4-epimerase [Thecamonas trahens ATCC 50062]|eukprot:XP_013758076.1 UDP-glucose 4-epimerase [Thecamonas trahens ATCC 50062]